MYFKNNKGKGMLLVLMTLLALYIVAAEVYVSAISSDKVPASVGYILVLGAAGDSQVLMVIDRIEMAVLAKSKYPKAPLLLSGNEKRGEISTYKSMLNQKGITDYIEEPQSTTTWNNLRFSQKMIPAQASVLIVTSSFHRRRSLAMARSLGIDAYSFSEELEEKERSWFYIFREHAAIYKYFPTMLWARLKN
ncbi:YdcF family protein [Bdellovibrio reynosensis]|uniref:YdcF family protein n=1 Tax=Bdellovibrio reynosensis TaxID=2835041 RepID=A0ABY4C847_9BACT|nr:YdcF family protein [Bdellovibrio reynosensis]UOF01162.1 YdcF family protein [Bdellovibrio reynosensis]